MAMMQRRLVHKQFNSPINLYSERNIQETLDRELKLLSNGVVGIDFDDPSTTKPPSLAKSAVLQALEDDERQQSRGKGLKRVAWPPPAEFGDHCEQNVGSPEVKQHQPYQHQPQQQQQYQPFAQTQFQQAPQQQHQQQFHKPQERIIPIQRPELSAQQTQYQPQATQAFQPLVSQQHQKQLYQQPEAIPQQQFYQQPDQVPFVTTLRSEPPMSQEPAPVYQTQPVAAIYQGGTNMRGDEKWPPAEYKKQSELENEERLLLAKQPTFRPRKVQKDYSNFFAKNALNQTYTSYRAPPGTQHHS